MNKICKRFRIVVKGREYEVGGQKKFNWDEIGKLSVFVDPNTNVDDMSFSIEINHMPGIKLNAFPIEKRNNTPNQNLMP